jgi:two-component system, chemotaxis family, protein-glutamate methylesterase/glutaminase
MDIQKIFLLPGEMHVTRAPTEIATLLGSCVAVCLYNYRQGFGGMNHFMLPGPTQDNVISGKHGSYAMELLIKMMLAEDPLVSNLQATVIGGGNVTGHLDIGQGIGAKNIVFARDILEKNKITIKHANIGGDFGRKVHFKSWTGEVEVKKIEKSSQTQFIEEKKKEFAARRIKVLLVDDSVLVRSIIRDAISIDPEIEVVGEAANPYEARELILEHDPDVICLDIIMPRMDGITFLKKLFIYLPKPVIIISTVAQQNSELRAQAEKIGAVAVMDKEDLQLYKGLDLVRSMLIPRIKAAAAVWVRKKTDDEINQVQADH